MARGTVIDDAGMIKPGAGKGRSVMAQGAILCRGKMAAWFDSSDCRTTIVARCTVINDTSVTENGCCKGTGYVTDTAILSRRNVADILLRPDWRVCRIITVA